MAAGSHYGWPARPYGSSGNERGLRLLCRGPTPGHPAIPGFRLDRGLAWLAPGRKGNQNRLPEIATGLMGRRREFLDYRGVLRRRVVLLHLLSHFMLLHDTSSSKTTFVRRFVACWLVRKNVHVGWHCVANG
ncbi:hypothetical protein D3C81_1733260 [compost metagenome]